MSTQLQNPDQKSGSVLIQAGSTGDAKTCRIGLCSPCLVVWGMVALWIVINALLGIFQ